MAKSKFALNLTTYQHQALVKLKIKRGITMNQLIRLAIDEFLETQAKYLEDPNPFELKK